MANDIEAYVTTHVESDGTENITVWTNDCPCGWGNCRDDDKGHVCAYYRGIDTCCGYTTISCAAKGE